MVGTLLAPIEPAAACSWSVPWDCVVDAAEALAKEGEDIYNDLSSEVQKAFEDIPYEALAVLKRFSGDAWDELVDVLETVPTITAQFAIDLADAAKGVALDAGAAIQKEAKEALDEMIQIAKDAYTHTVDGLQSAAQAVATEVAAIADLVGTETWNALTHACTSDWGPVPNVCGVVIDCADSIVDITGGANVALAAGACMESLCSITPAGLAVSKAQTHIWKPPSNLSSVVDQSGLESVKELNTNTDLCGFISQCTTNMVDKTHEMGQNVVDGAQVLYDIKPNIRRLSSVVALLDHDAMGQAVAVAAYEGAWGAWDPEKGAAAEALQAVSLERERVELLRAAAQMVVAAEAGDLASLLLLAAELLPIMDQLGALPPAAGGVAALRGDLQSMRQRATDPLEQTAIARDIQVLDALEQNRDLLSARQDDLVAVAKGAKAAHSFVTFKTTMVTACFGVEKLEAAQEVASKGIDGVQQVPWSSLQNGTGAGRYDGGVEAAEAASLPRFAVEDLRLHPSRFAHFQNDARIQVDQVFNNAEASLRSQIEGKLDPNADYNGSSRSHWTQELVDELFVDVSFDAANGHIASIPGIIDAEVTAGNQPIENHDWTQDEKDAFEAQRSAAHNAVSWAERQAGDLAHNTLQAGLSPAAFEDWCFVGAVGNPSCDFTDVCTGPGADWGRAQEAFGLILTDATATVAEVLASIEDEQECVRSICDTRAHDVRRMSDAFASKAGSDFQDDAVEPFVLAGALDAMALQLQAPCDNEVARLQVWYDHLAVAAPAALEAQAAQAAVQPAGATPLRPAGADILPSHDIRQAWLAAGGDASSLVTFERDLQAAADAGDVIDLMVRADQGERLPLQDLFGEDLLKPGAGEGLQWMQGMGQALVALRGTGTDLAGAADRAAMARIWLLAWADSEDGPDAQMEARVRDQAEALNRTEAWLYEAQAHLDGFAGHETALAQAWLSRLAAVAPLLGETTVHPVPLLPWRPASAGPRLADMEATLEAARDQHVANATAAGMAPAGPGAWSPHTYWQPEEPTLVPWEPTRFVVDSTGDEGDAGADGLCRTAAGTCTLRAALEAAMEEDITVVVTFDTANRTVRLGSPLPTIVDRSIILDGEGLEPPVHITGDGAVPIGLHTQADGTTVKGLRWSGFTEQALRITGDFARVLDNHIHDNGRTDSAVDGGGFRLEGLRARVENNHFENNAGRSGGSIHAQGAGHAFTGNHHINNSAEGTGGAIHLEQGDGFVSSSEAFERNRAGSGTALYAKGAAGVLLQQADISDSAGSEGAWKVFLAGTSGTLRENRIDGGNDGHGGILAAGGPFDIAGNTIHDAGVGLLLRSSPGSSVHGNTLSGNDKVGLQVQSDDVEVTDNTITGNGIGLRLESGDNHTVRENEIRGNAGPGIVVRSGKGHVLSQNAVTGNGGLAIDLAERDPGDGPTRNSLHNGHVNKPTLLWAAGDQVAVQYQGPPNTTVRIEAYRSSACHASGYGPLGSFMAAWTLTTNATGVARSTHTPPGLAAGQWLAATAATAQGTSEPGPCVQARSHRAVAIEARDHEGLLLQSPHRLDRIAHATQPVAFRAHANETDLVSFRWDLGDGTVHAESNADGTLNTSALRVMHAWDRPGTYEVRFTARYADGSRALATMEVRVVDRSCSGPLALGGPADVLNMSGLRVGYNATQASVADSCANVGAFEALLDDRPDITGIHGRIPLRYASVEPQTGQNGSFEVLLEFTYTDTELARLGLRESGLAIHYWNGTTWQDVRNRSYPHDIPAGNGEKDLRVLGFIHDTQANLVQVRVNHTSAFGIAGQAVARGGSWGRVVLADPAPGPARCDHVVLEGGSCTLVNGTLALPEGFEVIQGPFRIEGSPHVQATFMGTKGVLLRLLWDSWRVHEEDSRRVAPLPTGTFVLAKDVAAPTLTVRQEGPVLHAVTQDNVGATVTWFMTGVAVHEGPTFDVSGVAPGTSVTARATDAAGLSAEASLRLEGEGVADPADPDVDLLAGGGRSEGPSVAPAALTTPSWVYALLAALVLAAAALSVAMALVLQRLERR